MRRTRTTPVGVAASLAAAAFAGDPDPVREGLFPVGFAANLARTHEISLQSRVTPPGVTFGRTFRSLAVGDLDADGVDDVVMGFAECAFGDCAARSGATRAGLVRACSGADGAVLLELVGPSWTTPAQIDAFGAALALADINADGRLDLIVGAPLANEGRGRVDVFDSSGAFLRSIDGPAKAERFGTTVLRLGDATNDGRDDFLVLDSTDLGRTPTLWSINGATGAVLHSRTVLTDRVDILGDRDADGIAEYACGAPGLPVPEDRARAFRGDTGAIAFGYNAAEGFLTWLGDIDGDGLGEFVQFITRFEFRAPEVYAIEGDAGLVLFPPPQRAAGAADVSGDGRFDAATINGGPLGDPEPLDDELNFTDVLNGATRARFLPRHRALVGAEWLRHEPRRVAFGDAVRTAPTNADDIAIEVYGVDAKGEPAQPAFDRFVVAVYAGPWLPGDADADGAVNFADLNLVLSRFRRFSDLDRSGDVTGDGAVDEADVATVLTFFGRRNPSPAP